MVVATSTYYHARVLHHYPWRAADSTVYKWSKLITTTAAVFFSRGNMLHIIQVHIQQPTFVFLGVRREEPTTTAAATYRTSRISNLAQQQQQAVKEETYGSCANRDTNTWAWSTPETTETGHASRGRLSSDDLKRSLICLVRRMLCLQFALLLCLFRASCVASFRLPWYIFLLTPC